MSDKGNIGLALSGGGFRATLFHLGSLIKINETGLLKKINEITSVSGGSIISAFLGINWKELKFEDEIATNFNEVIVTPLCKFCKRNLDVSSIVLGIASPFHHPSDLLITKYKKYIYGNTTLQNLPTKDNAPVFTFYATNLQTGINFRFSKEYLAEYTLGKIELPETSIAYVVAASSAFPPFFCPVKFKVKPETWVKLEGTKYYDNISLKKRILLADGGVYDNLGLERIWDKYGTVLVSDAGSPLNIINYPLLIRFSQIYRTLRTLSVIMQQTRSLRKRKLVEDFISNKRKGTYWGITTEIKNYELGKFNLGKPIIDDTTITQSLSQIRTRLNSFSKSEQERLINWGYALTDAALRRHLPDIKAQKGQLPFGETSMN